MDTLSDFFDRVRLKGRLFYAGTVYDTLELDRPQGTAFIHILERGSVDLVRKGFPTQTIAQSSLLLCPSTCRYKIQANSSSGADIITASFDFGESMGRTYPIGAVDAIVFPRDTISSAAHLIDALIAEFRAEDPGRQKGLSVLFEYVLILLVRQAVARGLISKGLLFAMMDSQLGKALNAMHQAPEDEWSVAQLADLAGMSRSKFSAQFLRLVGVSPISYLTAWRVKLAQDLMRQGVELKVIASSIGYGSQASFTRAFVHEVGLPPAEWRKGLNAGLLQVSLSGSNRLAARQ